MPKVLFFICVKKLIVDPIVYPSTSRIWNNVLYRQFILTSRKRTRSESGRARDRHYCRIRRSNLILSKANDDLVRGKKEKKKQNVETELTTVLIWQTFGSGLWNIIWLHSDSNAETTSRVHAVGQSDSHGFSLRFFNNQSRIIRY